MNIQEQMEQLLMTLLERIFWLLNPFVLIPVIIICVVITRKNKEYINCTYYQITKLPYSSVKSDKGRYGEYLIYKYLKQFETSGAKFLFNLYIPKEDGKTTEIDVLMICSKGIFVFESKNYGGWIFGNENQRSWYQTLPAGRGRSRKERFYNPIMQNLLHIKCLKALIGEEVPTHSIVVFSDRCTLKGVQVMNNKISVIKRCNIVYVVSCICNQIQDEMLNESEVANIYNKLYPYTQLDDIAKAQHITNIRDSLKPQPIEQTTPENNTTEKSQSEQIQSTEQSQLESVVQNQREIEETEENSANATIIESNPIIQNNSEHLILKCPKCNGNLVLRTATRGANAGNQFYGCSNYPKCQYIQNIDNHSLQSK